MTPFTSIHQQAFNDELEREGVKEKREEAKGVLSGGSSTKIMMILYPGLRVFWG